MADSVINLLPVAHYVLDVFATQRQLGCFAKGMSNVDYSLALPVCHFDVVKQVGVRGMASIVQESRANFSTGSPDDCPSV